MILQDVLLGLLALVGIIIIANSAPNLSDQNQLNYMLAVVVGVFSTFVAALFSTINSTLTNSVNTKVMSFS
jgi:drug/metabolite transporter (DMT)-like permease